MDGSSSFVCGNANAGVAGSGLHRPWWMKAITLSTQRLMASTIIQYGSSLQCLLRGEWVEDRREVRREQWQVEYSSGRKDSSCGQNGKGSSGKDVGRLEWYELVKRGKGGRTERGQAVKRAGHHMAPVGECEGGQVKLNRNQSGMRRPKHPWLHDKRQSHRSSQISHAVQSLQLPPIRKQLCHAGMDESSYSSAALKHQFKPWIKQRKWRRVTRQSHRFEKPNQKGQAQAELEDILIIHQNPDIFFKELTCYWTESSQLQRQHEHHDLKCALTAFLSQQETHRWN